ncbi:MAG: hypothetical protein JO060_11335 [Candidatus Eremiobacteraeota bacterium]|nr:hypothetical protein [Candidatus Eremiobacteraeota bacterium]
MINARFGCGLVVALAVLAPGSSVRADEAFDLHATLIQPANAAIKQQLDAEKSMRARRSSVANQVAQARPVGEREAPAYNPALPKGFQYTLDVSSAWALGNTGFHTGNMPGGVDAVAAYGFSKNVRAYAAYFQLQEYPLGFDNGIVPVYLQGLAPPIGVQDLHAQQIDVTTKDKFTIGLLQNLVVLGKHLPLPLPIIISPGYIARTADVGGQTDVRTIEINGFPQTVHLRSEQIKLIAFTVPLVSSPKMFVSFTAAPQWLLRTNGANQTNHMQMLKIGYLEYRLTDKTTVFLQPSMAPSYLPPDPYPEHLASWIYGIAHAFTKHAFVQTVISTGTPANYPQLGIKSLTCQQLPCAPSQVTPALGGLKATQVQLIFGVGSPTTLPL